MERRLPDSTPNLAVEMPDLAVDTALQDAEAAEASRQLSARGESPPAAVPGLRLLQRLGQGAFGEVWLADQPSTGKRVAVKLYTRRRSPDWPLLAREVEKLAALDASRNVVNLLHVGWDHDPPYFVMEHLTGGSLQDCLADGPVPREEAVRLAEGVARGLARTHGAGILHCDLKPANVLLDADGEPRLCDFGQSRLATERDPALGTLYYMPPEQAESSLSPREGRAGPNVRWDVYAAGALLHHLLAGRPPHRSESLDRRLETLPLTERLAAYAEAVREAPPVEIAGVDRPLMAIVRGCLDADPERRTPSAQRVLDQLRSRASARSRRPYLVAGFLLPALLALAVVGAAWRAVPAAVTTTADSLIRQKLAGDALSAKLLAVGLGQDIEARLSELREYAADARLPPAMAAADAGRPGDLRRLLSDWSADAARRQQANGRRPDTSWFVTNARGVSLDRTPRRTTVGDSFVWRDYFHGRGVEYPPHAVPADITPRSRAGVSRPFRSNATGQYMVALAAPVRDAAGQTVGVIARTGHLPDLLDQWERRIDAGRTSGRLLALVDVRQNQLLDHAAMTRENLDPLSDEQIAARLRLPEDLRDALASPTPPESRRDYLDPAASLDDSLAGPWLAAFAPVAETGWTAIVQERREAAVAPVESLRRIFVRWGLILAAVLGGLLLAAWMALRRVRPRVGRVD